MGSGEGVKRFIADAVDFAGSDEILAESEASKLREAALMVPITAGMIALAYNIPGVTSEIKLPRDVYVDIFAGAIRQWDDPRIQAANPGLAFPHRTIAIVARQDSSGTTAAFTKHLAAIGPGGVPRAWASASWSIGRRGPCLRQAMRVWPGASRSAKDRSATSSFGLRSGLGCAWQR